MKNEVPICLLYAGKYGTDDVVVLDETGECSSFKNIE